MIVDATYPMVLRRDAALLHASLLRGGHDVPEHSYELYRRACLTQGCLADWLLVARGSREEADEAWRRIEQQPSIRLARTLSLIAEGQFSTNALQCRHGTVEVLNWVEAGCPGTSPFVSGIRADSLWPVPPTVKQSLIGLRRQCVGWIVYPDAEDEKPTCYREGSVNPVTGRTTLVYTDDGLPAEFPEALLTEEELIRYRMDVPWQQVLLSSPGH